MLSPLHSIPAHSSALFPLHPLQSHSSGLFVASSPNRTLHPALLLKLNTSLRQCLLHHLLQHSYQFPDDLIIAFPDIICHTGADMILQQHPVKTV